MRVLKGALIAVVLVGMALLAGPVGRTVFAWVGVETTFDRFVSIGVVDNAVAIRGVDQGALFDVVVSNNEGENRAFELSVHSGERLIGTEKFSLADGEQRVVTIDTQKAQIKVPLYISLDDAHKLVLKVRRVNDTPRPGEG